MKETFVYCSPESGETFTVVLAGYSSCDGSYHIRRTPAEADICVFEYVVEGTGTVKQDGRALAASAGDVYILRPGLEQEYWSSAEEPWTKLWFNLRGRLCDDLIRLYGLDRLVYPNTGTENLFRRFLKAAESGGSVREIDMRCAGVLHQIVSSVAESTRTERLNDAELLKEHMDRNYMRGVSIDELSKLIYKSRSQTARIFRREYGQSPGEYLRSRRLSAARILLRNTNLPIKQIAAELGFADEHYFSNMFLKSARVRPKEYRGGAAGCASR